jgi:hypothetical protein
MNTLALDSLLDDLDGDAYDNVSSPPSIDPILLCYCNTCIIHGPQEGHVESTTDTPTTITPSEKPVLDENLRASMLRQGKVGLTRREGRRRRQFKLPSELVWPVPYMDQPQAEWRRQQLSFATGLCHRLLKHLDVVPAEDTQPGREAPDAELVEAMTPILYEAVREAAGPYVVASLPHSGRWLRDFRGGAGGRTRFKTTPGVITEDALFKLCETAFIRSWQTYDHEYYKKRSTWGRTGGSISKRPPVKTPDMLDPYLGMTVKEQMAELACSKSMIEKLRRQHAYYKKDA